MIENYFNSFFGKKENAFCLLDANNLIIAFNKSFYKILHHGKKEELILKREYFSTNIHNVSDEELIRSAIKEKDDWSKVIHLIGEKKRISPYRIKTSKLLHNNKFYKLIELEVQQKKQTADAIRELEVEILQHLKTQSKLKQTEQI